MVFQLFGVQNIGSGGKVINVNGSSLSKSELVDLICEKIPEIAENLRAAIAKKIAEEPRVEPDEGLL